MDVSSEQPDRGAAGVPLVFGGPGMTLPKTLAKSKTRRIKAECRVALSLNTFFWPRTNSSGTNLNSR